MTFAYDTLAYVRKLREAKVPDEQAEAMAEALAGALNASPGVATKADLAALENRLLLKLGSFILVVAGFALAIARMWQP